MNNTNIDHSVLDRLENIESMLERMSRRDDSLWDVTDIARHLRMKKESVHSHILKLPTFPTAIKLETGGRRWMAGEIKAWSTRHRETAK